MATYATQADLEGYTSWTTTNPTALEKLLQRAERDVDHYLGGPVPAAGGLRYPLSVTLTAGQREALKRATCAQALYRNEDEGLHYRDQYESVTGPDFELRGKVARFCPLAEEELAGSGLAKRWRTVSPPA